jgi:hypothetical protein
MEQLFSSCTRYRDLAESRGVPPEWLRELNLAVSTDEFLSAERNLAYADLYAMLGNRDTIAWLTPYAAIVSARGVARLDHLQYDYRFSFNVDGKEILAWARSSAALSESVDVVLRLLAASVVNSVVLCKWNSLKGALINAPSLAYLMK